MWIPSTVKRIVAIVALAGAMACTSARAENCRTFQTHEYWESVACYLDGDIVTGALTHLNGGRAAAILIERGSVNLRLHGSWDLDPGDLARISVDVDGAPYRGRARAINDGEYEVGLSMGFLNAIIEARTAVINIGRARWTLNLYGVTASLKDAVDLLYLGR